MAGTPHAELTLRGLEPQIPERDADLWAQHARRRPGALVQVASIDTLRNGAFPDADLVVIDEAHRSLAPSYMRLRDHYSRAVHVGFTATPGKGLGDYYDEIVVVTTIGDLIREGYLTKPIVYRPDPGDMPDLSSVKRSKGDYDAEQLAEAVDKRELVGNIVEHWLKLGRGARTVAFAASVQHSRNIAAQFVAAGVPAEHLDGETPTEGRDAILARVDSGETLVVSNFGCLVEGWDQPSVKTCILARPTRREGTYLQMAGRILRPWEGQPAIILDHAGCTLEHEVPHFPRTYTLNGRTPGLSSAGRQCPACGQVLDRGESLCGCGYQFAERDTSGPAEPEQRDGELVQVEDDDASPDVMIARKVLRDYATRWARGKVTKPGWCRYRFAELAGGRAWPDEVPFPRLSAVQRAAVKERDAAKARDFDAHQPWAGDDDTVTQWERRGAA
jgi:DNA repair protein RadD